VSIAWIPRRVQTGEAPEELVPGEAVAAVDALGLRRREQGRQVVAGLAVPGREDLAGHGLFEKPGERGIAHPVEVGRDTDPVQVHVDRQGRGWRPVGETSLLLADFGEVQPLPAELLRDVDLQVACLLQFLEVLREEPIVAVVAGSALAAAVDQALGQDRRSRFGDGHGCPPSLHVWRPPRAAPHTRPHAVHTVIVRHQRKPDIAETPHLAPYSGIGQITGSP
jgi:hypothetical protein